MNQTKRNDAHSYFESRISACKADIAALNADDRQAEAIFVKIQLNVYDIFNTVLSAAEKSAGDDDGKLLEFFLTRLQQIPQNWNTALANAGQHGDVEKAHLEQIKLDAAAEIRQAFEQIWEVSK